MSSAAGLTTLPTGKKRPLSEWAMLSASSIVTVFGIGHPDGSGVAPGSDLDLPARVAPRVRSRGEVNAVASHPEGDPWVLVADVLAEAGGVDPSRSFDVGARALAKTMRGVRRDWAGRPCITWSVATELLDSLRAEVARRRAEIEERLVAADAARRAQIPRGVPLSAVPAGVSPGEWLMRSDPQAQGARRRSVLEDALAGSRTTYHPIGGDES
jgi:hypothetical protein